MYTLHTPRKRTTPPPHMRVPMTTPSLSTRSPASHNHYLFTYHYIYCIHTMSVAQCAFTDVPLTVVHHLNHDWPTLYMDIPIWHIPIYIIFNCYIVTRTFLILRIKRIGLYIYFYFSVSVCCCNKPFRCFQVVLMCQTSPPLHTIQYSYYPIVTRTCQLLTSSCNII